MKRIALLICGLLLLVSNTAEARRRGYSGMTYTQPSQVAHTAYYTPAATSNQTTSNQTTSNQTTSAQTSSAPSAATPVSTVSYSTATTASYSTATAQGVANLMASYNRVGHFGGNPGYEGCGCGATPQAAYSICCYGNSGMATVDVGYAQGSNGM